MNGFSLTQFLDIAIVLVAVYASLSTICSWAHEWIATRLALRGWDLFRGISQIVGGDKMAAKIFDHPLVNNTSPFPDRTVNNGNQPQSLRPLQGVQRLSNLPALQRLPFASKFLPFFNFVGSGPPSYLDARNFSNCFWQVVLSANASPQANAAVSGNAAATVVEQIAIATDPTKMLVALKTTVAGMTDSPSLQKSLIALLAAAGNDYENLLRATDGWFNAQMDRVSGWYKRRTKTVMFFIALVVVSIAGIDTSHVVKVLSATDRCTLQKLAAEAGLLGTTQAQVARAADCTEKIQTSGESTFDLTQFAQLRPDFWRNWRPGLVLTWLAVWLGGPFWFDVLCSLANVRSAGRKPKRNDQPPR